eukprot:1671159-Amphidinium_carterae.1
MGRSSNSAAPDKLLRSAYVKAMEVASQHSISYLGVSLLSAGIFRGRCSLEHVLAIGVEAVAAAAYPSLKEVHLIAFKQNELQALLAA